MEDNPATYLHTVEVTFVNQRADRMDHIEFLSNGKTDLAVRYIKEPEPTFSVVPVAVGQVRQSSIGTDQLVTIIGLHDPWVIASYVDATRGDYPLVLRRRDVERWRVR